MMRKRRPLAGFTLVEVLVSVVILAIGLLGAVQCIYAALLTTTRAERIALATAFAQNKIEEMRSSGTFENVQPTPINPLLFPAEEFPESEDDETEGHPAEMALLPDGEYYVVVEDYNALDTTLKKVTVVVTWMERGATTTHVQLETLATNRTRHVGG